METTSFGFAASLLFVGVPTIFLIGLFVSTSDGEKSSFYSDSSKGRLSPEPKKWTKLYFGTQILTWDLKIRMRYYFESIASGLTYFIKGLR